MSYRPLPDHLSGDEEDDTVPAMAASTSQLERPRHKRISRKIPSKRHSFDLDAALRHWKQEIARKIKRKKSRHGMDAPLDILVSVFTQIAVDPFFVPSSTTLTHTPNYTEQEFDHHITFQVQQAILLGVHPRLNAAGSSGSYMARSPEGQILGIFKPKDEEPYGSRNPKWSKWVHRHVLGPFIGFGRNCLIPNLSYLSETAASLIDARLGLNIVPTTELAYLSSPAFYYDWIDRKNANLKKNPKPLHQKVGSMQLFLGGYEDASKFLQRHPWPGNFDMDTTAHRKRKKRRRDCASILCCASRQVEEDQVDDPLLDAKKRIQDGQFSWTTELMADFRQCLEKLVILDVLITNTDRGLDNFMIKPCLDCSNNKDPQAPRKPHMHLAAIDNSLAFPVKHPNEWRSYAFGWLWLPASMIGLPFSAETRKHFLPLLSSPQWWEKTTYELRVLFMQDPDFSEKMFAKQIAVMKGQAYNIVQSLLHPGEGPLELCQRQKCIVRSEVLKVPDNAELSALLSKTRSPVTFFRPKTHAEEPRTPSPSPRPQSSGFSPYKAPSPASRPIVIKNKLDLSSSVLGRESGVKVIEHMEKVAKSEAKMSQSLGVSSIPEEGEEDDPSSCTDESHKHFIQANRPPSRPFLGRRVRSTSIDAGKPQFRRASTGLEVRSEAGESVGDENDAVKMKRVIIETLEFVDAKPFFKSC